MARASQAHTIRMLPLGRAIGGANTAMDVYARRLNVFWIMSLALGAIVISAYTLIARCAGDYRLFISLSMLVVLAAFNLKTKSTVTRDRFFITVLNVALTVAFIIGGAAPVNRCLSARALSTDGASVFRVAVINPSEPPVVFTLYETGLIKAETILFVTSDMLVDTEPRVNPFDLLHFTEIIATTKLPAEAVRELTALAEQLTMESPLPWAGMENGNEIYLEINRATRVYLQGEMPETEVSSTYQNVTVFVEMLKGLYL